METSTAAQSPTLAEHFQTILRKEADSHYFIDIVVVKDGNPHNTIGPTQDLHTVIRWERYMHRCAVMLRDLLTRKIGSPAEADMVNARLTTLMTHMVYECELPNDGDRKEAHRHWMLLHPLRNPDMLSAAKDSGTEGGR